MTEQNPFGGLAVADPRSAAPQLDVTDDGGDDNRRKLAVVGAVVAVIVVLIAAFFLMKGKGGPQAAPAAPNALAGVSATSSSTTTTPTATGTKTVHLPKAFAGTVGRDPFKALYIAPAAQTSTPGTTTGSTPTTPVTAPVVTVPTGTTPGSTPPSTGSTGSSTGLSADFVPVWVELVRVQGTGSATFVVGFTNGKRSRTVTYGHIASPTSGVRTVFAKVFSLLSIQNGTATVQVGDGTPFDLTRGFSNRHYLG